MLVTRGALDPERFIPCYLSELWFGCVMISVACSDHPEGILAYDGDERANENLHTCNKYGEMPTLR